MKRRGRRRVPGVSAAVILGVAGIGCASDEGETGSGQSSSPATQIACETLPGGLGTCAKPDGQRLVIVGRATQLRLKDVAITIREVENRRSLRERGTPTVMPTGVLVIFKLSVHNIGSRPLDWSRSLSRRAALLIGDQEFPLRKLGRAGFLETAPGTSADPIAPKTSAPKRLVFDVPKPAAEQVLERSSTLEIVSSEDLAAGRSTRSAHTIGRIRLDKE